MYIHLNINHHQDLIMYKHHRSMEQHNQLIESSTVSALKSEVTQLEDKVKREIKQQEVLQEELAKLGAKYICLFIIYTE